MMITNISRKIDRGNLVRELAYNKVDALELLREALSNAKDHGARTVWVRATRGAPPQQHIDLFLINDGDGLDEEQREAFWGVSKSIKPENQSRIGYKGHGTKLYFSARRLSVATRSKEDEGWRLSSLNEPLESNDDTVEERPLPEDHPLAKELREVGLWDQHGVAILIERCSFPDATRFLSRRTVESYCDWFTVVGDVRSGLFLKRSDFHEAVTSRKDPGLLREHECSIRSLAVHLRINGERKYYPIGFGPKETDARYLEAWRDDADRWRSIDPGMAAFGHRFADHFASERGASQIRDDRTALCVTTASQFSNDSHYALVIRVEGRRRQLETYQEGSRQPVGGEYDFNERFGMWLCKDFIPIVRKNDWLQEALTTATERVKRRQRFELSQFRHWQIFVNHQAFVLTANRNDVTNATEHKHAVVELVAKRIEEALKESAFAEWIENLQRSVVGGKRERELDAMRRRVDDVVSFFKNKGGSIELGKVEPLELLDEERSIRLPVPKNEQEVFYLYAVLSGRFELPLRVIEYDTRVGIDAVALVSDRRLFDSSLAYARLEFKYHLQANRAIGHFFDAIDAFVCWSVSGTGDLLEASDVPEVVGKIRKRKPRLPSGIDSYEVETTNSKNEMRVLPVIVLDSLFKKSRQRSG